MVGLIYCHTVLLSYCLGKEGDMEDNYLKLSDLHSYVISFHLSNYVWTVVLSWDYHARDTVGRQFVRAIDSISANIAEGFGRYGKKDKIKLYR